jgi:hypothetical protein
MLMHVCMHAMSEGKQTKCESGCKSLCQRLLLAHKLHQQQLSASTSHACCPNHDLPVPAQ